MSRLQTQSVQLWWAQAHFSLKARANSQISFRDSIQCISAEASDATRISRVFQHTHTKLNLKPVFCRPLYV